MGILVVGGGIGGLSATIALRNAGLEVVFGDAVVPAYTGQVVWRYNVPRAPEVEHIWMFSGSEGKAGLVPLAPDLMYLLLVETPPPGEVWLERDGQAALLRERLAEFGGLVGEVRDTHIVDDDAVVYRPLETILAPAPWHRGRTLLIGDAAHATTPHVGQGAAQAVEDAVVLSELLGAQLPLDDVFEAFMARRYERCRFIVESSLQIGRWEQDKDPEADFVGLTARSLEVTSAPI
jgi:2-polyprenyl-6-methoxyphenol hydroxylase-like FAD-dependent oxidoreductase